MNDKYSFLAIPLSTKDKFGTWYYQFRYNEKFQNAQLAQSRVVSYKRLKERMGMVDSNVFIKIKEAFTALHKI